MHRKQIEQVIEEPEAQGAIYPDWRLAHREFLLVKGNWRCVQPPMSSRMYAGLWMGLLDHRGMYPRKGSIL